MKFKFALGKTRLEFVTDQPWTEIGLWSFPTNISTIAWPGDVRLTWDAVADAWVFYLPEDFFVIGQTFIFNNAATGVGQTAYIQLGGASRIYWLGGSLTVVSLES